MIVVNGEWSGYYPCEIIQKLIDDGRCSEVHALRIDHDCTYEIPDLTAFVNLVEFNFEGSRIFTVDCTRLPSTLKSLSLSSCNLDYKGLFATLTHFTQLEYLKAWLFSITHDNVVLPYQSSLTQVVIDGTAVYNEELDDGDEPSESAIENFMQHYSGRYAHFFSTDDVMDVHREIGIIII